jgi:hypothetical protein
MALSCCSQRKEGTLQHYREGIMSLSTRIKKPFGTREDSCRQSKTTIATGRHSLVVLGLSLPYVVTARLRNYSFCIKQFGER